MSPSAIYLVRHCHAQARDGWTGNDDDRPLTARGTKEAVAIVSRFDVGELRGVRSDSVAPRLEPAPRLLLSSAAKRCLTTLEPLASASGLPVTTAGFLAEGSDAAQAVQRLKDLAAERESVVACSHGDVIWAILELLSGDGAAQDGQLDVKKGSIWVLESESGRVTPTRYIPPGRV
ncbi:MAG: phosphoglycerate mutase family protein [Acidimicrobiales bacterium]|jgi:8-oxo-dGTP diphosphatase